MNGKIFILKEARIKNTYSFPYYQSHWRGNTYTQFFKELILLKKCERIFFRCNFIQSIWLRFMEKKKKKKIIMHDRTNKRGKKIKIMKTWWILTCTFYERYIPPYIHHTGVSCTLVFYSKICAFHVIHYTFRVKRLLISRAACVF